VIVDFDGDGKPGFATSNNYPDTGNHASSPKNGYN